MNTNNLQGNLKTLFENDYPGSDLLYENLISPLWAGTEKSKKVIFLDEEDKNKINSVVIFAFQGSDINFVDVELADSVILKRNRVTINKYISKIIVDVYQSVLIFFHYKDSSREWRISYVYKGADNTDRTNPKRFTYLCGKNQHCRTAAQRFSKLEECNGYPTGQDMMDTFSVEPLTKDFFEKYKQQYADLVEYISGKRFVKVKGKFIEEKTKNANPVFKTTFDGDDKSVRDYVKKMMGRLVFLQFLQKKGWLGVKKGAEWGTGDKSFIYNLFDRAHQKVQEDFLEQVLEPLFFNTLNYDRGPDALVSAEICSIYGEEIRIPYLNGGLFEKDTLDEKKVKFKKEHFQSLFDFFRQYNFTIDETDPDDTEIGVDPEMLGKIFENLLEDNKDKGAFYTPKEIVQYMCRESLIAYLMTDSDFNEEKIRTFVLKHTGDFSDTEKKTLLEKLHDVKVCDPAVGSGAFPMGMLNELYACRHYLEEDCLPVEIKKQIIKENLYGVDIEKGAVDIARLRFWLSIVVDEEIPLPLPNLDYKIMQGNSLLESYKGIDLSILTQDQQVNLFDTENTVEKLIEAINGFYMPHDQEAKAKIRLQIKELILQRLKFFNDSETVAKLSQIDLHANTSFFLWHTWFYDVFNRPDKNNGFDIVIGNPPYISAPAQIATQTLSEQRQRIIDSNKYKSLYQKWDLYIPFIELGIQLSCYNGIITMIVPFPLTNQLYAKKLRKMLVEDFDLFELNDLNGTKIFENATVSNCIPFIKKNKPQGTTWISNIDCNLSIKRIFEQNHAELVQDGETCVWNVTQQNRTTKRHTEMHVLGDYCYISYGLRPNSDEKTAKGKFKKQDLISPVQDTIPRRKYIEAKDIEKYVVLRIRYLEYGTKRSPSKLVRPTFDAWFEPCKLLFNRLGSLKGTLDENNKLIHNDSIIGAALWKDLHGIENKSINTSIKKYSTMLRQSMEKLSETVQLKYLLGIMNSKYASFLLSCLRGNDYHIYPEHIRNIPVPNASMEEQQPVISLVDKILAAKKENPSADTSAEERQIDLLVYRLYNLTFEEAKIIDNTLTEEEFNRGV